MRFSADLGDLRRNPAYSLPESSGAEAVYVEVIASRDSMTASFLALLGLRLPPLRRLAVAESHFYACDVTPLMLCHPQPAIFTATARPGRQYLLRMDGNTVAGSLALLDRPEAAGERQALVNLASDAPAFCYADRVRLRTNVSSSEFDEALNTRFDRYTGRTGPIASDLAVFPPAPNVLQGRHFETCRSQPQGGDINPPFALPRDTAYQGFRLSASWDAGAGDWSSARALGGTGLPVATALDEYLAWNHGDKGEGVRDRLRRSPTRYQLYLAELGRTLEEETISVDTRGLGAAVASMPTGGPISGSLSLRRESAVPVCYAGAMPPTQPRRRILYATVSDCAAIRDETARAGPLSRVIAKLFLTEPSEGGATLVEFVALVRPTADDGKLRHVVQLVDTN